VAAFLEEGREGLFRSHGDHAATVEPEDRKVVEDLFRLVKVGEPLGIVRSIEPLLGEQELRLVVEILPIHQP
jgi:hypothetical protein